MTSCDDILGLYLERKAAQGPVVAMMRQVRDVYNGDVVVPLPERESNEKVAVANLMAMGLDQMADRVASIVPDVRFPVRRNGSKAAEAKASDKRRAVQGWWDGSLIGTKMYRRGRHLLGYGTSPVIVRPDFRLRAPRFDVRDPLETFAAPQADPDNPCVDDCIFSVFRTLGWLRHRYPAEVAALAKGPGPVGADLRFEVLEYVCDDEIVVCVVGRDEGSPSVGMGAVTPGAKVMELERFPNRTGVCPAVVPGRVNLDRRKGQYDGMIGMYQAQAKLFALDVIAVEQGVFPDEWLVGRQGETPEIIQVADGRSGRVGMVKGGDLRQQNQQPGYQTGQTLDRLERAQRLTSGTPADFGGESSNNIRTGRRGENVLSATIDFTILQAHRVLASSLQAENVRAIEVDKAYFDVSKSFYVSWDGSRSDAKDYRPSELFDTTENWVTYSMAGTDQQGIVIAGGQRIGQGTLSKQGFMEIDPMIEDPEKEMDRVVAESLEAAMLSGIQQQAASGQIPPNDVARVAELVRTGRMDLAAAITKAHEEAQARQAMQVPAESPEAQPGMALPGAGAEATPAIGPPQPSQENLASLLGALRRPQALTAPSEAPAAPVAV